MANWQGCVRAEVNQRNVKLIDEWACMFSQETQIPRRITVWVAHLRHPLQSLLRLSTYYTPDLILSQARI